MFAGVGPWIGSIAMCVTIGLPFYNNKSTIALAARSVFAQSFADWELLLVDDGSTDGSLDLAYAIEDPRVRVISDGENRGLAYRLNQIAQLAGGEYLARMDADDVMFPARIERQVQFLDKNPAIDLVGTAVYTINANNEPVGKRGFKVVGNPSPFYVLSRGLFIHPTVMGRTAWFRDNPYDVNLHRSQDRELWCRTYLHSKFAHLPEPLLFYREQGSVSLRKYLRNSGFNRHIFQRYGPNLVGLGGTMYLLLELHLKDLVYIFSDLFRFKESIVQHRNSPLAEGELRYALEIMRQVQNCNLPGIDK